MEKSNDELTFDAGKITRFFKKNEKKHHQTPHPEKGIQSSSPKEEKEERPHESEFTFNWHSIKQFFIKYQAVFLLLIPLFLSIFIRLQPITFPLADNWATSTLDNALQQQISAQIEQQYPNLPAANKDALVASEVQKFKETNKDVYEAQKKGIAEQLRDHFRDDKGYFYMPDIDPYFYLRYARNVLEKGDVGDVVRNDVQWDNHGLAPLGGPVTQHIHPYMLAWMYKLFHLFNRDITPMQAAGYFPVLFSALAIIPLFFIARRIAGNMAGFITAMTLAVHVALTNRTIFGHADTDPYNVFFPLLIFWLFIECYEQRDWRKKVALGIGAGLSTGLFSWAWSGWWYIFDFILAAIGLYVFYIVARNWKNVRQLHYHETVRNSALSLGIFIVSSGIFVSLISSFSGFIRAPLQPLNFIILKVAAKANLWPNVYTTVAELNEVSFQGIVSAMGGPFIMALAALGIILIFFNKERKDERWLYGFIVALWFFGMIYASTKGVRFTMLLVPPLGIGLGVIAGKLYRWTSTIAARELHIHKTIMAIVFCVAFLLLLGVTPLPPFCTRGLCGSSMASARGDVPIINDAWYNALNKIRLESQPNAIINSWWDFGHHFKYYADRAVTFDGGSQNRPQAHWVGKVLLTADEKQAIAILRMLDCGGNTVFDIIENVTGDTKKAVDSVYELLASNPENARKLLAERQIPENKIEEIIERMYCEPPEDYFITSDDMVGKAGVWAHFGSWNFERASAWLNTRNKDLNEAVAFMKHEFGHDEEQAKRTYFEIQSLASEGEANSWIAPWPSFISTGTCMVISNTTIQCQLAANNQRLSINVDYKTKQVVVENAQGKPSLATITYTDQTGFHQLWFNGTTIPYGMIITRENNQLNAMLVSPELTGSLFTRLYFFGGLGLQHFKPFTAESSFVGTRVYVWKIDWEGNKNQSISIEG